VDELAVLKTGELVEAMASRSKSSQALQTPLYEDADLRPVALVGGIGSQSHAARRRPQTGSFDEPFCLRF